ncbi:CPBP family intramembrane glutamic endopeptidase [Microbacterium sp. 179-I 3D3 NHS]|uniref:CPBP family intramembrane glutamic endopeptidase n=1 Tax=Microbacterium sp. 179-I 3D3 NHS TaxID=3142382 RepID=UPI00399F99A2
MSPRVTPRLWMALPAVVLTLVLSILVGPAIADVVVPGDDLALYAAVVIGVILVVALPALWALGWLRAVFFERERVRALVPTLLAFGPLLYIGYCIVTAKWDVIPLETTLTALILAAVAGIGEELTFRGVAVVTLRARLSEVWVAVLPALTFGLVHLMNLGGELPTAEVLYQVVYAILFGFAAYALRRVTGGLLIPIIIHTFNNAFENIADATGGGPIAVLVDGAALPDILFIGGLVLGTVSMVLILQKGARGPLAGEKRLRRS